MVIFPLHTTLHPRLLPVILLCSLLCIIFQEFHDLTMSEKRRAEIEAKRAKLVELRKARAERQKADAERRVSEVCIHRHIFRFMALNSYGSHHLGPKWPLGRS